jgi:hypothetical protein
MKMGKLPFIVGLISRVQWIEQQAGNHPLVIVSFKTLQHLKEK